MKIAAVLAGLLFSLASQAGEISLRYGLGAESGLHATAEQRMINLRYADRILKETIKLAADCGAYWDNHRKLTSGHCFVQAGTEVRPFKWMFVENLFGPGFITMPDDLIGGHFQFSIELGVGIIEPSTGARVQATLKHLSDAGIKQPNRGRNFWLVSVGWRI